MVSDTSIASIAMFFQYLKLNRAKCCLNLPKQNAKKVISQCYTFWARKRLRVIYTTFKHFLPKLNTFMQIYTFKMLYFIHSFWLKHPAVYLLTVQTITGDCIVTH